jgi:hypothetical protein
MLKEQLQPKQLEQPEFVIVVEPEAEHPPAVTVTLYAPGAKPVAVCVVCAGEVFQT